MKKVFALLVAITMITALMVGCGSNKDNQTSETTQSGDDKKQTSDAGDDSKSNEDMGTHRLHQEMLQYGITGKL
ncbi:MAG: hypothetical protein GX915_05715 [Clostridiales bacterium]|nr:hypothetical protein [Clostridiales bacterium]